VINDITQRENYLADLLLGYSLRVFSPAGAVGVNGSSKTGVDATIW
jgi:hypothetical protein